MARFAVLLSLVSAILASPLEKRACPSRVDISNPRISFIDYPAFQVAADDAVAAVEKARQNLRTGTEFEHNRLGKRALTCDRVRVRKEWRRLTREEQKAYMVAEKCLMAAKRPPIIAADASWYDLFTHIHQQDWIRYHGNAAFLPWHRWFVWTHGYAMEKFCNYTGPIPYWDFIADAETGTIFNSPIFSTDPEVGFGNGGSVALNEIGGSGTTGYKVDNGAFANWRPYHPVPHFLLRNFTQNTRINPNGQYGPGLVKTYNKTELNRALAAGDFWAFENIVDGLRSPGNLGIHNGVHFMNTGDGIGPDFLQGTRYYPSQSAAPNDPLFWIQHANVDYVWWQWQQKSKTNQYAFTGPMGNQICDKLPFSGWGPDMPTASSLVTEWYPLCYTYEVEGSTPPVGTTSAPVVTPTAAPGTVPKYGQCGGQGYTGPTACVAGSTCTKSNDYFWQCL